MKQDLAVNLQLQFLQFRFYLGLAISLSKGEWKKRGKDAIKLLQEGMEMLLSQLSKEANLPEESV